MSLPPHPSLSFTVTAVTGISIALSRHAGLRKQTIASREEYYCIPLDWDEEEHSTDAFGGLIIAHL